MEILHMHRLTSQKVELTTDKNLGRIITQMTNSNKIQILLITIQEKHLKVYVPPSITSM